MMREQKKKTLRCKHYGVISEREYQRATETQKDNEVNTVEWSDESARVLASNKVTDSKTLHRVNTME